MPDRFTHTVAVAADPSAVWSALQDADTWRGIGPIDDVRDATHDPDGTLTGYRWAATAAGRRYEGTARRSAMVAGRSMRLDLASSEITGAIEVTIEPAEPTGLTVTMEASPKGPLASMFWPLVREALRSGTPRQVEQFAARFSGA
jgi:carbon monoxide dehydrogenase subunit G